MSWVANLCGKRKCAQKVSSLCGGNSARKESANDVVYAEPPLDATPVCTPRGVPRFQMESSAPPDMGPHLNGKLPQLNALLPLTIGSNRCGLHRVWITAEKSLCWQAINSTAQDAGSLTVGEIVSVRQSDDGVTAHTRDESTNVCIRVSGAVALQWAEAIEACVRGSGKDYQPFKKRCNLVSGASAEKPGSGVGFGGGLGIVRLSLEGLDSVADGPESEPVSPSEDSRMVDWIQSINSRGEQSAQQEILKIKNMPHLEVKKMITPRGCRASPPEVESRRPRPSDQFVLPAGL